MIQSKKDLKYYLSEDLKRFNNHKLVITQLYMVYLPLYSSFALCGIL